MDPKTISQQGHGTANPSRLTQYENIVILVKNSAFERIVDTLDSKSWNGPIGSLLRTRCS